MNRSTWLGAVGLFCAAGFAGVVWAGRLGYMPPLVPSTPQFEIGQDLSSLLPKAPPSSRGAFVIFVDTECDACITSTPAYRHLVSALSQSGRYASVAVSVESQQTTRTFVRQLKAEPSGVVLLARRQWKVRTPSLLRVDERQRIVQQWFRPIAEHEVARLTGK